MQQQETAAHCNSLQHQHQQQQQLADQHKDLGRRLVIDEGEISVGFVLPD
jgi:hypothetical protein